MSIFWRNVAEQGRLVWLAKGPNFGEMEQVHLFVLRFSFFNDCSIGISACLECLSVVPLAFFRRAVMEEDLGCLADFTSVRACDVALRQRCLYRREVVTVSKEQGLLLITGVILKGR